MSDVWRTPRLQLGAASADNIFMECTRCGEDAVVKRSEEFFCAKCAIAADWQTIIASVQDAVVESPVAGSAARTA